MEIHEKARLRRVYLDRRRAIPPAAAASASRRIHERLMVLDTVTQAPLILSYLNSKDNEVETLSLLEAMVKAGRRVLAPVTAAQSGPRLCWAPFSGAEGLKRGRFGILEPAGPSLPADALEPGGAVFVPGLVFSPSGKRIGYGAGCFDRFLETYRGARIGLAYEAQLAPALPAEAHDALMDYVVTEARVYACSDAAYRS